jgi:hypothetical protein
MLLGEYPSLDKITGGVTANTDVLTAPVKSDSKGQKVETGLKKALADLDSLSEPGKVTDSGDDYHLAGEKDDR